MAIAYLLTGGNIGDRKHYLEQAKKAMGGKAIRVIKESSLYETAAWGKEDQEAFLNQALCVETALDPDALLQAVLSIEESLGRKRMVRYGPRIIDIDILLYEDLHIQKENLQIPHPQLPNRRFALQGLSEIA